MEDVTETNNALRRMGVVEGPLHMAGAALVLLLLTRSFEGWGAAAVMAGIACFWALVYAALRVARVRTWFGAWDFASFGFVWSYAVVLALAAHGFVSRLA